MKKISFVREVGSLVRECGGELTGENVAYYGICCDSRRLRCGDVFAVIDGKNHRGAEFIPEILAKGASFIITENAVGEVSVPVLRTENPTEYLKKAARFLRERELKRVIAVTGSVGKTTVRCMISSLLEERYSLRRTEENRNNSLGLSLSVVEKAEGDTGVFELGISRRGEMEELSFIAKPTLAVITGIGKMHMEAFGTREGTAEEKSKIARYLDPDGKILIPYGEVLLDRLEKTKPCLTVGTDKKADYRFFDIRGEDKRDFTFYSKATGLTAELRSPIAGTHGVTDCAFALAVAEQMGVPPSDYQRRLNECRFPDKRGQWLTRNGVTVYLDCYNAGPESVRAALETVAEKRKRIRGKTVLFLGSMLELGDCAEREHRAVGRLVAELHPELLIGLGREAEWTVDEARRAGLKNADWFEVKEDAFRYLSEKTGEGDLVCIKGSRKLEMEKWLENSK